MRNRSYSGNSFPNIEIAPLSPGADSVYTWCVYNLAADNLFNYAQDPAGAPIQPGSTALTWMLSFAQAFAQTLVNCTMPPLLAA